MIPKKIHYCWFGGAEIPEHDKECIESWKKYCPDYEIIRWDESSYDVHKNQYMSEAYQAKKWGFVPDYARLDIIYNHGGVYLDTDVELVRNLDDLLNNKAYMGFEQGEEKAVNPGLGFGAEKNMPLLKKLMDEIYDDRKFKLGHGDYDTTPSPKMNTDFLVNHGMVRDGTMQEVEGLRVYPWDFFCPIDTNSNIFTPTENTHSIHHFHASWLTPEEKKERLIHQKFVAKYGENRFRLLRRMIAYPYRVKMHLRTKGLRGTAEFAFRKLKKKLK